MYYSASNHTQNLAFAIADGARSDPRATVRCLSVSEADYKTDVLDWADVIVIGSPVHNANIAAPLKAWLDGWDYVHDDLSNKSGGVFATGGHLFGGIENTLNSLQSYFHIFGVQVWVGEQAFQPNFPLGVGAATGDPPFNSSVPGRVDPIFLDAGKLYGKRLVQLRNS